MGHGTRNNGQIKTYWPDDDENTIYLSTTTSLKEIAKLIWDKWRLPWCWQADDAMIEISAERIHTDCLTYDLYDSGDYTTFIVIRRNRDA